MAGLRPDERVFYFTTCGWMMWNWLVSALASEATLMLYDGSPFYPDGNRMFDFVQDERAMFFGTSAKFIDSVKKAGLKPAETHPLPDLETLASTGSPLVPESFDFVYEHIKQDVALTSVSGGTDLLACFVGSNPQAPIYRGEIQAPALGMAVEIWNEAGEPVIEELGELVCTRPFPTVPLCFWNDPDGTRLKAAYFEKFPGVWCHGDLALETRHGGYLIMGRSDAVLNPGGVRIGTAEIYRQVEQLDAVLEAVAVAQDWDGDVRVVLFVVLREGLAAHRGVDARDQDTDPCRRDTAARASGGFGGSRYSPHQIRQDHRTRRSRHHPWARSEKRRGVWQTLRHWIVFETWTRLDKQGSAMDTPANGDEKGTGGRK